MKKLLVLALFGSVLAPRALALDPNQLTADERKQYDALKQDAAAATSYLDTRGFLRQCRKVESNRLDAKSLPIEPADYNKSYVSSAEQKLVDDAIFKSVMATIGG